MANLFQRLPTGPITAGLAAEETKGVHKPWSFITTGDRFIVYLPANLEEHADNMLTVVCVAACKCLNPIYRFSSESTEPMELDKKQISYLAGVAWALNCEGFLQKFVDTSGAMGHGYYYVCHKILANVIGSAWWAKGSQWHWTKGLTGKNWSTDLNATMTRVSTLVSKATSILRVDPEIMKTWCRVKQSFIGHELRKPLLQPSSVIMDVERNYLSNIYHSQIQAYEHVLDGLTNPTRDYLDGLDKAFQIIGHDLKPLALKEDEITSHRMSVLYPTKGKKAKKKDKTPIKEVISSLDLADYIFCFDPSVWAGYKPFKPAVDDNGYIIIKQTIHLYTMRIEGLKKSGKVDLAALCEEFILTSCQENSAEDT
jgi:hypothetical protein